MPPVQLKKPSATAAKKADGEATSSKAAASKAAVAAGARSKTTPAKAALVKLTEPKGGASKERASRAQAPPLPGTPGRGASRGNVAKASAKRQAAPLASGSETSSRRPSQAKARLRAGLGRSARALGQKQRGERPLKADKLKDAGERPVKADKLKDREEPAKAKAEVSPDAPAAARGEERRPEARSKSGARARGKAEAKRPLQIEDEELSIVPHRGRGTVRRRAEADGAKRQRREDAPWHEGKSRELLLRCFEKELALTLKIFFTDPDILSRRKASYFRRNYLEVPDLRKECEAVLEDINQMAGPRVEEAVAKSGKEDRVDRELLHPHMLKMEEQRAFLKLQWPSFWASLGDRVDYRRGFLGRSGKFGSGTAGAIRAALADWWYEDIHAWVNRAEQGISNAQMARLLFDGKDDHLELKVSGVGGMGRTASFVLAETDGLEVLARLVNERLRQNSAASSHCPVPAWTFRITDGVRKARAEQLLKRVLEMGSTSRLSPEKSAALRAVQESAAAGGGDVSWLNRLVETKAELGLIPEHEAAGIQVELKLCLPFARVACSSEEPQDDDWIEILPLPALIGSLPTPDDEPLLAHADAGRTAMELEFQEGQGSDRICRVEAVARVPADWKRPYGLNWN